MQSLEDYAAEEGQTPNSTYISMIGSNFDNLAIGSL